MSQSGGTIQMLEEYRSLASKQSNEIARLTELVSEYGQHRRTVEYGLAACSAEATRLRAQVAELRAALTKAVRTLNNQPYFTHREDQRHVEDALWFGRQALAATAPPEESSRE